jgi:hypothetical protein
VLRNRACSNIHFGKDCGPISETGIAAAPRNPPWPGYFGSANSAWISRHPRMAQAVAAQPYRGEMTYSGMVWEQETLDARFDSFASGLIGI